MGEPSKSSNGVRGLVFDIQRFSVRDGPGIRTTVFLKGCPLRCAWCHNPESRLPHPEILLTRERCIDCGRCAAACPSGSARRVLAERPQGRSSCRLCFHCVEVCPSGAIELSGEQWTATDVLAEVEKDRAFYEESKGGLTISGGEPTAQFDFTRAILTEARSRSIHTCVQTCGCGSPEQYAEIASLVDLFLWDVKDTDADRHLRHTGSPLQPLLDNLRRIDQAGARSILRCLLIAKHNLNDTHLQRLAELFAGLRHADRIELLPYHPLGGSKYERLGLALPDESYQSPSAADLEVARSFLADRGAPCVIV